MARPFKENKIKTEPLNILIPEEVKHMLIMLAGDSNRSQTAEVIWLIKQEFERQKTRR
jgi:hypothetical protein